MITSEELRSRYEAGATIEELYLETGLATQTVRKRLKEAGTQMRAKGQRVGVPQGNKSNAKAAELPSIPKGITKSGMRAHRRRGGF